MLTGGGQLAVAETEAFQAAPSKFANDLLFELPPHATATTDEIARSVRFICTPPKMVPPRFQRTTSHYLGTLLQPGWQKGNSSSAALTTSRPSARLLRGSAAEKAR